MNSHTTEYRAEDAALLSVVVCSYNGANTLTPCLEALARQRSPVEVLLVDDGSTDETSFLALSYGFTVVRHGQRRGIEAARNTGLAKATSRIVAFCDEHCTPPEDWTEQLQIVWRDSPGATVLGGLVEVDQPQTLAQNYLAFKNPLRPAKDSLSRHPGLWNAVTRQFHQPQLSGGRASVVYSVDQANMSLQRVRVLDVGGFDETSAHATMSKKSLFAALHETFGDNAVIFDPRVRVTRRFDRSIAEALRFGFENGRQSGATWRRDKRSPALPVVGPLSVLIFAVIVAFNWPIALLAFLAVLMTPAIIWQLSNDHSRRVANVMFPFIAWIDDWLDVAGFIRGANSGGMRSADSSAPSSRRLWTKERWQVVAPTGLWLAVTLVLSVGLALAHSPITPLPGVITMLLIPGASVLATLRTRPATTAGRVVLSVCLSMMVIMVVGGVASLLGPHLGVAHPLDVLPESTIWFVLALAVLFVGVLKTSDPVEWVLDDIQSPNLYGAGIAAVLILLSILGVGQLNHSGNNFLSVFTVGLDVLVLVAGVVGTWKRTSRWPLTALLYGASLALLLSTTLRGGHLDGWDVQQEFGVALRTVQNGVWVIPANHDPYASMLSLTVLPAVLHSVVKLRLLAFFQLVVPAILALLPVAVFTTIKRVPRWITYGRVAPRPGLAFGVTVGLIVSSVAFSSQLGGITRQAMALTMMTALVMVLFDRTMLKRPAQVVIGMLLIAISFTHYTTSYLLSAIFLSAWVVSVFWSKGWMGTAKAKREKHRRDVKSRQIINAALVVVALAAAFGWNLGVTRNTALNAPTAAITTKGAAFATSTGSSYIPPRELERVLLAELRVQDNWLIAKPTARAVKLDSVPIVKSPGVAPKFAGAWDELSYLTVESVWVLLGIALLYGLFRLGRRRGFEYSSDLVGLAVAGLLIGVLLRFSGTLAAFYNPERAAIFTAILLAAPVTLFLDDLARLSREVNVLRSDWVKRSTLIVGTAFLAVLVVSATGLDTLFFGGTPPENLVAKGLNVQDNTVTTPEFATAAWLKENVGKTQVVQSDLFSHLVLLSQPGSYNLLPEIVPAGVDRGAYIYLSTVNLADHTSQAATTNLSYIGVYRTTLGFFNRKFYVVYSNGATRVYH